MKTGTKIGIGVAVAGLAALGVGIAIAVKRRGDNTGGLGKPGKVKVTKKNGMTVTHYRGKLPINERVGLLQDLVYQGVQDPAMRKLALQITKDCPARDGRCEANAIDIWVRQNIRYTGDIAPIKLGRHGPVESIDFFQAPKRTVEFGGEDCDGHAALNATLLALNGITSKFRVTSPSLFGEGWSHIYVVAGLPKERPSSWVVMDTTLPNAKLGQEHSSAKRRDFASGAPPFVKEYDA